jgi:predicted nucleic acid-binding protein
MQHKDSGLIYLDVCCLNRPFDDQTQHRILLESEAIIAILERCESGQYRLLGSEAVDKEISALPDAERREKVSVLGSLAENKIQLDDIIKSRAKEIMKMGFKTFDALHLTCAESGHADIFLTTDDKLLDRAKKNMNKLKVQVENPVIWLMEVMTN